VIKNKMY